MGSNKGPIVYITRKTAFSAAHRLNSGKLNKEENKQIFSKCNHTHGHNYRVEVTLRGQVDPITGMVINITDLDKYMSAVIDKMFDHKNIDEDVPYFKETPSSMENVTVFIFEQLKMALPNPDMMYEVKVHETDKNVAYYRGE